MAARMHDAAVIVDEFFWHRNKLIGQIIEQQSSCLRLLFLRFYIILKFLVLITVVVLWYGRCAQHLKSQIGAIFWIELKIKKIFNTVQTHKNWQYFWAFLLMIWKHCVNYRLLLMVIFQWLYQTISSLTTLKKVTDFCIFYSVFNYVKIYLK